MTLKNDKKICRGLDFLFEKWHEEFEKFWQEHSKVLKEISLEWTLFRVKYILLDLKWGYLQDTKEWCKIWRKTDFRFGKWQEEFGKFSPEYLKVSKLGLG